MNGRVAGLWVYPVKSMRGQALDVSPVDARGFAGDRLFAVRDEAGKFGSGKNTRRFARMDGLARWSARAIGDRVEVRPPDGDWLEAFDPASASLLTDMIGRPVEIAREANVSHFDAAPIHLITSGDLAALRQLSGLLPECESFRPNLLVETQERSVDCLGRCIEIGDVQIKIIAPTERCLMVNLKPDGSAGPDFLRVVAQHADACFGVYANVLRPGRVAMGAALTDEN